MTIVSNTKILTSAALVTLSAFVNAQLPGHEVGDTVCVVGYVMDDFCIQRGTLLDNSSVKTLEGPEKHSVHCLIDVTPCVTSPFNILVPPAEGESMYSVGYYVTDNQRLIDLSKNVGSCGECNGGGSISSGLRLAVTGVVQESQDGRHLLEPTDVAVADESQTECGSPPAEDDAGTLTSMPSTSTSAPTAATVTGAPTSAPTTGGAAGAAIAEAPTSSPTPVLTSAPTVVPTGTEESNVLEDADTSSNGALDEQTESNGDEATAEEEAEVELEDNELEPSAAFGTYSSLLASISSILLLGAALL